MADGVSINWGALQPVDVGGAFQHGVLAGRQQRAERETRNALKAYAANPEDTQAVNSLMQYNPQLGLKLRQDQREQQARTVQRQAATGDRAALAQLAGIDIDAWDKLSDNDRQASQRRAEVVANAAMFADTPERWDAVIGQLSANGYPELAQYRGQFSPEARAAAIAGAGKALDFMKFTQPDMIPVQSGGTIYKATPPRVGTGLWNDASPTPIGSPPVPRPTSGNAPVGQGGGAPTIISEAEAARLSQGMGSPEEFMAYQRRHNVAVGKQINGQAYYLVNGKWYDNPEGR